MSSVAVAVDDHQAVVQQVARSHQLLDDGHWDELVDDVFAPDQPDAEPVADFGFDRWVGTDAIRDGYATSLPRFEAAVHLTSNVHVTADGDGSVTARYDLQGWHWLAATAARGPRPADFLVLGRMTDRFRRHHDGWRIFHRSLRRHGPSVAVGALPDWLSGLGATTSGTCR